MRQPTVNCDAFIRLWLLRGLLHCASDKEGSEGPEASVPVDRQKLYALDDKHIVP